MSKLLKALEQLIRNQINERGILVWYDPEEAYGGVVDRLELEGVGLLRYKDGYFRVREQMEAYLEWVGDDGKPIPDREVPPRLLVYGAKERTENRFTLIEAETAGVVMEPGASENERNTRLATLSNAFLPKYLLMEGDVQWFHRHRVKGYFIPPLCSLCALWLRLGLRSLHVTETILVSSGSSGKPACRSGRWKPTSRRSWRNAIGSTSNWPRSSGTPTA